MLYRALRTSATRPSKAAEEERPLPEWLLRCEGIDTEQGAKNCGGTEEYISLEKYIEEKYPDIEMYVIDGGQEIYPYILVAE